MQTETLQKAIVLSALGNFSICPAFFRSGEAEVRDACAEAGEGLMPALSLAPVVTAYTEVRIPMPPPYPPPKKEL